VRFVAGEVQDGTANDGVHRIRLPGQRFEHALADVSSLACHPRNRGNGRRVPIDGTYLETVLNEKRQVAPCAAPGVQNTAAAIEAAAQQLIEQIDVDITESLPQFF
jgi:hypothetical protein